MNAKKAVILAFFKRITSSLFVSKNFPLIILTFTLLLLLASFFAAIQLRQTLLLSESERMLKDQLGKTEVELNKIKNEDQFKRNEKLQEEITNIQKTYKLAASSYEQLIDFNDQEQFSGSNKKGELEKLLSQSLNLLSDRNYASAEANLVKFAGIIQQEKNTFASTVLSDPKTVTSSSPPVPASGGGAGRQRVETEVGTFGVDVISADLNSTRVIVDTASGGDCRDNCPVLSVGDYASRNGAFAAINGSYFCPASYPSCAGKTNSFDTLLMNKNKVYFNSDNNVYSNVPVAVFGAGWARFIGASSGWGRDTGVDGVIANQPLLLSGGNIVFGGDGDPKKGSRGSRSFIGVSGSTVYIGVIHNATVAEMGYVLKKLGLSEALNLDSGGSTALWQGGYIVGPGRNIPNAVLFVRR